MAEDWTFLTNHGFMLLALARQPDLRLKDLAAMIGITERSAQEIVNALVAAGYLERVREGRRNRYLVHGEMPLRHGLTQSHPASHLIGALTSEVRTSPRDVTCRGLVLACSDYRFQEGLRQFLAAQGLLGGAEIVLWPGGGASLTGPDRDIVLERVRDLAAERQPERVLMIAHQDCTAQGIFRARRGASRTYRALVRERREAIARLHRVLGVAPEIWYMDLRRARRVVLHESSDRQTVPRAHVGPPVGPGTG
jgi:plasmid maintenance system antidote protein VapI